MSARRSFSARAPMRTMDINAIVKRKSDLIAENLVLDDAVVGLLYKDKVISASLKDNLLAIPDSKKRLTTVLGFLASADIGTYEKFFTSIEPINPWISDELQAELIAEVGDELEDYIEKEAGIIVHREFGNSKRLAETEKSLVERILAIRTQYGMNVWKKQLERATADGNKAHEEGKLQQKKADKLATRIREFNLKYGEALNMQVDVKKNQATTGMVLTDAKKQGIENLQDQVEILTEITAKCLLDNEALISERDRALRMLRIKNPDIRLENEIGAALERAARNQRAKMVRAEESDDLTKELYKERDLIKKRMEKDIVKLDVVIKCKQKEVNISHKKMTAIAGTATSLRRRLQLMQDELDSYKSEAEKLENSKRLVSLHKRDSVAVIETPRK